MSAAVRDMSKEVIAAAEKLAAQQIDTFCGLMADACKSLSPVDTGHNRDSITYKAEGLNGEVWTESGYGGWLEIGTSKMAAQPYFQPAFEQTKGEMK